MLDSDFSLNNYALLLKPQRFVIWMHEYIAAYILHKKEKAIQSSAPLYYYLNGTAMKY